MEKKDFQVGQVWLDGNGQRIKIDNILDNAFCYPIIGRVQSTNDVRSFTAQGKFAAWGGTPSRDLVCIMVNADAVDKETSITRTFKRQIYFKPPQMWRTRDGQVVVIIRIDEDYEDCPITARFIDADDDTDKDYRADGTSVTNTPAEDLVEHMSDDWVAACKFKPGDKWYTRDGSTGTVIKVDGDDPEWPILVDYGDYEIWLTRHGLESKDVDDQNSDDLITKIKDTAPESEQGTFDNVRYIPSSSYNSPPMSTIDAIKSEIMSGLSPGLFVISRPWADPGQDKAKAEQPKAPEPDDDPWARFK